MRRTPLLVLIGGAAPDAPPAWVHLDTDRDTVLAQGGFGMPPPAGVPAVLLIIPASDVLMRAVTLEASTLSQARMALPWVMAAGSAQPAEDQVCVLDGPRTRLPQALALVVHRDRLSAWQQAVTPIAPPGRIVVDANLLDAPGGVGVLMLGERVVVAGGGHGGFAIEPALAPRVLAQWLDALDPRPATIALHASVPTQIVGSLPAAIQQIAWDLADPMVEMARRAAEGRGADLGGNTDAPARLRNAPRRRWGMVLGLAALAGALHLGTLAHEAWRDAQMASALRAEAETRFRAAFPEVQRIVNLEAQVRGRLQQSRQGGLPALLIATEPLTAALAAHPDAQLDRLTQAGPTAPIEVVVSAASAGALEPMLADLRRRGAAFEPGDIRQEAGRAVLQLELHAEAR
jgi:type II secretion system protein L